MSGGDDEHLAHAGPCLSSMIWQWIFILRHTHGWFCSGPVPSRPPVLIVVQGSSRIFQEGNLLVTGVNTFCIFNPRKCLQTGSCHPGKWVCDLYPPPLAESEWWKLQTPPGGPAARLGVGLWSKAFICPAGAPSALSSKNQLRAGAETVWKDLQKKCGNSYLDSAFQSVAFALQRIEFLTWRALLTFFEGKKKKTAMSRRSVSAACKQCLSACAVCRETSKGSGADQSEFFFFFFFLGAVNTPDKDHRRYVMCRKLERWWGKKNSSESLRMARVLPTSDLMLIS